MIQHRQLALPVHLRDDATLENFLVPEGLEPLLAQLREQSVGQGEPALYLAGGGGSGKTHLLQAACHLAGDGALYLPLAELADYAPQEVLTGVAGLRLVCLDDLQAVAGRADWELALFHLYNEARERGCRLLFAATGAPRTLAVSLADLASRLSWAVVYQLPQADDARREAILRFRAARRGLTLPPEVATFLVSRLPRDLEQLLDCLDRLDRESLARQRALSIPFAKAILDL